LPGWGDHEVDHLGLFVGRRNGRKKKCRGRELVSSEGGVLKQLTHELMLKRRGSRQDRNDGRKRETISKKGRSKV